MATTLPQYTAAIDNAFVETWYEVRPDAIDNILSSTPMWAILKQKGCFDTQTGGKTIERTIKYATPTDKVTAVSKGDTLPMGETETETAAFWKFRYLATPIQRTIIDDRENSGKFKIKSYVEKRLKEAREAMGQVLETDLFRAVDTTEAAHKHMQSLNDLVPPYASRATGTYGGIARSNSWWQPKYKQWTATREVNMVADMRNLFNTCSMGMGAPDLIVTDQTSYELYEEFGLDASQIAKTANGPAVDLGFETLKFKGADMIWSENVATAGNMFMLNTGFIEVIYDPNLWFSMTDWKPVADQMDRIAHIMSTLNMFTTQPRRMGLLYT